ncbi:MAG: hypothetical protein H6702_14985 [Myxococcales bacterium]|nr:hypothetical protein [Myxococcales bacterium]
MRSRLLILALWAAALPGCLWDFEFFEDVSEVGAQPPAADASPVDGAVDQVVADRGPGPAMSGDGPNCRQTECAFLAIDGGRVAGLAPDQRGGLWVLVHGDPQWVRARGDATLPFETPAASHLIHATGPLLTPRVVIPLPFQAQHVAAVNADVYVTGTTATGGVVGDAPFDTGDRNAVLLKLVQDRPQWWLSWRGQQAAVTVADGTVWLVGGPGNAEIHHSLQVEPVQVGAFPDAPAAFVAKVDGAGGLALIQPFGDARTSIEQVSGSRGGYLALAGIAPGAFTTWDGGQVPLGRFVAVLGSQLGLNWATAWPFNGSVELDTVSVGRRGQVWLAGQPTGTEIELGGLPPTCAQGPFVARAEPEGTVTAATALAVDGAPPQPGSRIHALGGEHGESAAVLFETYGPAEAVTELGGRALARTGLQLGVLNADARALWTVWLGPPSANAAPPRFAVSQDDLHYVATELTAPLEWSGESITPQGTTAVVLRYAP